MESRDDQIRELEAELQRIQGGAGHIKLAQVESATWPAAEFPRVMRILRTLPDGAGMVAVARALGLSEEDGWHRENT